MQACPLAAGAVYNVVDDDPAGRLEVMQYAARLLEDAHEPVPGLASAGSSLDEPPDGGATSSSDNEDGLAAAAAPARTGEKRVSNQRIKRELGVRLAFPTYREGLAAIVQCDMRPFD